MRKITMQAAAIFLTACILFAGTVGLLPIYTDDRQNGIHVEEDPLPGGDPDGDENEETPQGPSAPPPQEEEDTEPPPREEPPAEEDAPADEILPPAPASYVRAKVDGLNVRTGPGTQYTSLGSIDRGDMLVLLAKEGGWYRTSYKNRTAYISAGKDYTELFEMPLSENDAIEKVIDEGTRLLGFPYVYGATRLHDGKGNMLKNFDATKYDCSSLMQYIFYYGAGVNLNMTTRTQVSQGTFVAKKDIRRGDLIFFTNSTRYNKTGVERIGHVALYLGENYILHTASDYAVIEEISAQRWKYYIETRRMV